MTRLGGAIAKRQLPQAAPPDTRTGPDPTFLEGITGSFDKSREDQPGIDYEIETNAYSPLIEAVTSINKKKWWYYTSTQTGQTSGSVVWNDIAEIRAANPRALPGVPATREEFDAKWRAEFKQRQATRADTVSRSGWAPYLIGGFAGGLTDPVNAGTMILGGGPAASIGKSILREAIVNGATEAFEQPLVAAERAKRGQTLTVGEAATNVAMAAALGGAVGGATKGVASSARPTLEAILPRVIPLLPDRLKQKYAGKTVIDDADLPDIAEAVIGKGRLNDDERAAGNAIRRKADIDKAAPFEPTGAGVEANTTGLADAMGRILSDTGPARPRSTGELRSGTSLSSGSGGAGFRPTTSSLGSEAAAFKARVRGAESSGNDVARAGTSSAYGRYQFVKRTWRKYYIQRFGRQGLTDTQIYAKRADGDLNEILMDDLTRDNAKALSAAGFDPTAGNLYLAHFAGASDAKRILRAAPDTPIGEVMDVASIAANQALFGPDARRRITTAGELRAWTDRKMGGRGDIPAAGGAGDAPPVAAPDVPGGTALVPVADRVAASFEAEPVPTPGDPVDPRFAADDPDPAKWYDGPQAELKPEFEPRAPNDDEVADAVRSYVQMTRESLKPSEVADRLGVDRARASAALERIAQEADSGLTTRGGGRFAREDGGAPRDLLKFIVEHSGISDRADRGLFAARNLSRISPSGGLVFKKSGRSLDTMRELAAEAGYFHDRSFGDAMEKTTVDDFVQMLEDAYSTPRYALEDVAAADFWHQSRIDRAEFAAARGAIDQHLTNRGIEFHPVEKMRMAEMMAHDGLDAEAATARIVNEHLQDVLDAMADAAEKAGYGRFADDLEDSLAGGAGRGGARVEGSGDPGRPAPGSGAGGEEFRGGARADADSGNARDLGLDRQPVSPDDYAAFSDPTGPATASLADSLLHDMRPRGDPNLAAKGAQEAKLKADAPMRAATDQDSTIGAPLFDAADQFGFKLDDGDHRTLGDVLREIDDEGMSIKNLRDCL